MNEPDVVTAATRVADEVLWPRALATDRADAVPVENLDALAAAGLYGIFAPVEAGGMGADGNGVNAAIEVLAGACLTTTLVWVQHEGSHG